MVTDLAQAILISGAFALSHKSKGVFISLLLCPFLLWPGNTQTKIYLLIFSAFYLLYRKIHNYIVHFSLLIILLFILTLASRPAHVYDRLDWSQYTASSNQLRGEHWLLTMPGGQMFHNKITQGFAFINHSISAFNPSEMFIFGDKDSSSNSLWLSPLPFTFLLLLFLGSWRKFLPWIFFSWLMSVFNHHYLYESNLTFFYVFIVLGFGKALDKLSFKRQFVFVALTIFYLIPAIYFSLHYHV